MLTEEINNVKLSRNVYKFKCNYKKYLIPKVFNCLIGETGKLHIKTTVAK
jgi:hypothetical protein